MATKDLMRHKIRPPMDNVLNEPVLIKNLPFGECMGKWTLDYLNQTLCDKVIVVHESQEQYHLDFARKNFVYKKCKFSEFAEEVRDTNSKRAIYLRSTNANARSKLAARIEDDFPALANDLKPPSFVPYGKDDAKYHSSVLRIASKQTRVWMHFDLYDNLLCQLVGVKTVYLFPPTDSKFLYLDGDKSRIEDLDDWESCKAAHPKLVQAHGTAVRLQPGDCLFIPSMWWHQVVLHEEHNETLGYSIGFNIFWRDSKLVAGSLYAPNDIYGNKNLLPYDAALANLDKAMKHLEKLPEKYGDVYREMFYRETKRRFGRLDNKTAKHSDVLEQQQDA